MKRKSKVFDIIVLVGMVVNILLAVFLILYYFDFFCIDFPLIFRVSQGILNNIRVSVCQEIR